MRNKRNILTIIFLSMLGVIFAIACAEKAQKAKIDKEFIGKEAICPVTGDKFVIHESTPVVEYKGEKYYMCCPGCDDEFMRNPERYIDKMREVEKSENEESKIEYWTCSMHPEVNADEAGNCPICGMALIPVYERSTPDNSLNLTDRNIELAGIRTVPAQKKHAYKEIRAVGVVAYDPQLFTVQEEYLNALEMVETIKNADEVAQGRAEQLIEHAEYKLRILGMGESEIKTLKQKRKRESSLILPEHETWVYAEVYESDIAWIKKGEDVVVTSIAHPGEEFHGQIISTNPVLNFKTRSVQARIRLGNTNMKLRPGMYVETVIMAKINASGSTRHGDAMLVIPRESVLDTGMRKIVWVYRGNGNFEPREVKLGPDVSVYEGDKGTRYYPVLDGLKEDELVVTNGNFLLDSESRLTGIAAISYGGALGVEEHQAPVMHQH